MCYCSLFSIVTRLPDVVIVTSGHQHVKADQVAVWRAGFDIISGMYEVSCEAFSSKFHSEENFQKCGFGPGVFLDGTP